MSIRVLGWGSLIWDPGNLNIASEWNPDGPPLPIEFARFSNRNRLTLVLVEGSPLQPTLWATSGCASLEAVRKDLREREGTGVAGTSSCRKRALAPPGPSTLRIVWEWLQGQDCEGAVWTSLGPNRPGNQRGLTSDDERIAWLRGLVASGNAGAAREYFERAPVQIATPLRQRIRDELGWR